MSQTNHNNAASPCFSAQGTHLVVDLYQCNTHILTQIDAIQTILLETVHLCHAHVLQQHFHHFGGAGGVTGVLVLQESHASIHTWPEHAYAAVDIFMCGQPQYQPIVAFLQTAFSSQQIYSQTLYRGTQLSNMS